ncbi:MAG: hypothetical protein GTO46_01545 [Gemmatimonadetes bacterium]|nr:hypothetical protein [Gemmatimonadota bacterium]NIO31147.1 hypothetical protein [Gemmatimonadota bacterium]
MGRLRKYALGTGGLLLALAIIAVIWLKYALAFEAPDQFLRQKGELAGVEVEAAAGDSLYEAYDVRLTSSAGYGVHGHLRVPRAPGRWPSLIVIGGTNTGRLAAELVNPDSAYVILGLDYPWDGPVQLTWWQFLVRVLAVRRAMLLTPSAVMLGVDYLETRPEVDSTGVVLVGASFGAQLITVVGALEERAGPVLVIYGGGDYRKLLEANLDLKPRWLNSALARAGAWLLDPIEPLHYAAQVTPRPMIIINGSRDSRIPQSSVDTLFATAREPKQLIWLDEGHISSRDPALLERVLQAAVEALEKTGEIAGPS